MASRDDGTIIASRELILREGGTETAVEIAIHAPIKTTDGAYCCRYTIGWPDELHEQEIFGFDGIQALVLALQMIGFDIHHSAYHEAGKLSWGTARDGYGFPVHAQYRNLLIGDDAEHL